MKGLKKYFSKERVSEDFLTSPYFLIFAIIIILIAYGLPYFGILIF